MQLPYTRTHPTGHVLSWDGGLSSRTMRVKRTLWGASPARTHVLNDMVRVLMFALGLLLVGTGLLTFIIVGPHTYALSGTILALGAALAAWAYIDDLQERQREEADS